MEIDGVGTVTFPLKATQARQIIKRAERAPFGRGEETITDTTTVRNVWQLPKGSARILGDTWRGTLDTILSRVTLELGCFAQGVTLEPYKVLLYDKGGFFLPHRDTEKTEGMFGTLVISLPSAHTGGALMIAHGDKSVKVDLATKDLTKITYAAFYADCMHEVRPVNSGYRFCLIYNLIQAHKGRGSTPLCLPTREASVADGAAFLSDWLQAPERPRKIAYLLQHQYSPAGLSFSGLKGADATLVSWFLEVGSAIDASVHLGIVHIEEMGIAEVEYSYRRRSRWRNDEDDDDDKGSSDYEVVEALETVISVSDWMDPKDRSVRFGKIPIKHGELLPIGALDYEAPDRQRVTEATGNEGATYERSYHRAAVIIWSRPRSMEVLMEGGAEAAVPYLASQVSRLGETSAEVKSMAWQIVQGWKPREGYRTAEDVRNLAEKRIEMLSILNRIADSDLVSQFLRNTLSEEYDGTENAALAFSNSALEPGPVAEGMAAIVRKRMPRVTLPCLALIKTFANILTDPAAIACGRHVILEAVLKAAVDTVPEWGASPAALSYRQTGFDKVQPEAVVELLNLLRSSGTDDLLQKAIAGIIAAPSQYLPDTILLPALVALLPEQSGQKDIYALWVHITSTLLARNEYPPKAPEDWAQPVMWGVHEAR